MYESTRISFFSNPGDKVMISAEVLCNQDMRVGPMYLTKIVLDQEPTNWPTLCGPKDLNCPK